MRTRVIYRASFAVLAAAGLSPLSHRARTVGAAVGIGLAVTGTAVTHATLGHPDYRGVAQALHEFGWTGGQPSPVSDCVRLV